MIIKDLLRRIVPRPLKEFRQKLREFFRRIFLISASKIPAYNYYRSHDVICITHEQTRMRIVDKKDVSFRDAKRMFYIKYKAKNVLPFVDFHVGTICTLRCRDCTQWNPYMKTKEWYPADEVIEDIKNTLGLIDYIVSLSLIGGETFAYPELEKPLHYCINNDQIGYIILTTNGTQYPNEDVLELLKNKKVITTVDNYNVKDVEVYNRLVEYLRANNCNYELYGEQHFTDLGKPRKLQNVNDAEKIHRFWTCWLPNASEIIKGKYYRCGRTFSGMDIGLFDKNDVKSDFISISDVKNKNEMKDILRKEFSRPYLNTCAACNSKKDRIVYEAAIQIED